MKDEIQKLLEKIRLERREKIIIYVASIVVSIFAIGAVFGSLIISANADEETPHGTLTMSDNFGFEEKWKNNVTANTGRKTEYTISTYFTYKIDNVEKYFINKNGGDGNGNYTVTLGNNTANGELPDDYLGLGFSSRANSSENNRDLATDFGWKQNIILDDGTKLVYDHIEIRETPTSGWTQTISPSIASGQLLCNQSSNPNDPSAVSPYGWRMGAGNATYFWVNDTTEIKVVYEVVMYGENYHTVPTLGSESGIKINMFDYSRSSNSTINDSRYGLYPYFVFRDSLQGIHQSNSSTDADGYTENHATVKAKLGADGYPVFNCRGVAGCSENSLGYLFGAASDDANIKNYLNISNTIIQNDGNGYYYYDSNKNAVDFDTESQKFYVRDYVEREPDMKLVYPSGRYEFFPFNTFIESNSKTQDPNSHQDIYDYNAGTLDYWFGMTIEFKFFMPKDGKINGEPMIFNFMGDDDVFVFIDDNLILDLGGTHGPVEGSINFATGDIDSKLNWKSDIMPEYHTTMSDIIGMERYEDFSIHTLKMFYLERGAAVASNKIGFNMPIIPNGTVTVQKKIANGADITIDPNAEYQFTLYGEANAPISSKQYTLNGLSDAKYITDEKGNFFLKQDDIAMFELENGTYRIIETSMPDNIKASSCMMNGFACQSDLPNDTGNFSITNSTNHNVIITNEPKAFDLTLRKEIIGSSSDEKFHIRVEYDNVVQDLFLEGGESNSITDIPFGSNITITELSHNGYNVLIKNTDGESLVNADTYFIKNLINDRDITIVNIPGVELPKTGGVGKEIYELFGLALILVPCVYYICFYFRKRKGDM